MTLASLELTAGPTLAPRRLPVLVKTGADRLGALLGLLLLVPVLLVIAALVRLDGGGQALVRQRRIGRGGREFEFLKFRTMCTCAELHRPEAKSPDDPRVTAVGRVLRRWSLDELPQLVNVLRGDMSLVGPRPPLAREVEHYAGELPALLRMRPGMTGLWQVSGRADRTWDERVQLDRDYVERWSLRLDAAIALRTVSAVVRGRGAY